MTTLSLGLIQSTATADKNLNIRNTCVCIENLAKRGAKIICLQELFASPYFCQNEDPKNFSYAEEIPGPTTQILSELASRHQVVIVASLFEKRAEGIFHNTAVVLDADGSYLGKYRKMHIPDDPSFLEKYYFTPGDLGYQVFQTRYARVGVLICWDQWYPEAARLTASKGAQILFYPTAIGRLVSESKNYGERQYSAWRTMQVSHAIANGVFVASVNRVGVEDQIDFFGGSFVSTPFGDVVVQGSSDQEQELLVEINLDEIAQTRQDWPFWRDRRIDSYANILKRFDDE